MLKRVLVPLDGSSLARVALDVASGIVDPECEITLLIVVQPPDIPVYVTTPMVIVKEDYNGLEIARRDAKKYLENIAAQLSGQGFSVAIQVEVGEAAQVIAQVAASLHVDMIIMTTHGRSGISRWLYGSVTARVLSLTTRPVLVVPNTTQQEKLEREYAGLHSS